MMEETGYVQVLLEQVPPYLQNGDYFMALSENDGGSIAIPDNMLKADLTVASVRDLQHLLECLRFWIVLDSRECVEEVVKYLLDCDRNGEMLEIGEMVKEFEMTFPYLLIILNALHNVEKYRQSVPSPLILSVLDRHQCSFNILTHISKQHCFTSPDNKSERESEKDHRIGDFLCQYSIHSVIEEGSVNFLKYLYENGIRSSELCATAVECGSVESLHFLRSQGEGISSTASSDAAGRGHVSILKYLHDNGLPVEINCVASAALNGQLECLRYLHSIGHPWGKTVSYYAARNSHFECLKFAHEHGCKWDEHTCSMASRAGHMDCLQYALEHGCPYASSLAYEAFAAGHDEIGFYVLEHCANLDNSICTFAAEKGRLDILRACVRAGIPWPSDIVATATRSGHRHCAEFALAHGALPGLL